MAVKPPMGTRQGAPRRHRRERLGRPAALRRHARQEHRRDRPGRRHQDREEGQAQPAHPRRRSRDVPPAATTQPQQQTSHDPGRGNAWQTTQANGWSRPTGWPRISTRRVSSSSTAPCTCPPPSATPRPSTWPSTSPARCSSTSTTSRTRNRRCRTCCPPPSKFASRMKKMGIGDGMHVVAYDSEGLYSAARVWWMFRAMGHEEVRVLNGGLKKWKAEGRAARGRRAAPAHRAPLHGQAQCRAGARRRRREGADRQQGGADRRRPRRRPLRGQRARAARRPALRPHPGLAQRAVRLAAQRRRHAEGMPPSCAPSSPRPASIRPSPSSPPAAPASPPAWWRWRWPCSAAPTPPSTTAPGPNGAPTPPADRDGAGDV